MNDNYAELYAAIWGQAVADDLDEVRKYLFDVGFNKAYKVYLNNIGGISLPITKADKKFFKFKKDLRDYIKMKTAEIEQRIKELIVIEETKWPFNRRNTKANDEDYQMLLQELKEEVLKFSEVRMGNVWRRL